LGEWAPKVSVGAPSKPYPDNETGPSREKPKKIKINVKEGK